VFVFYFQWGGGFDYRVLSPRRCYGVLSRHCYCLSPKENVMDIPETWPGNSVGIVTDYGLDGPGIESR
jgi:hypothetical protein